MPLPIPRESSDGGEFFHFQEAVSTWLCGLWGLIPLDAVAKDAACCTKYPGVSRDGPTGHQWVSPPRPGVTAGKLR